jgi:hypothetical protein
MSNIVQKVCVYIGPGPALVRKVLQLSIQRRAEVAVDFKTAAVPWWAVPWACEWHGVAVHLSPWQLAALDVSVLADAAVSLIPGGPAVMAPAGEFPGQVMAINCAAAKKQWQWHLPLRREYLKKASDEAKDALERGDWLKPKPGRLAHDSMLSLAGDKPGDKSAWLDPNHPCAGALRHELVVGLDGLIVPDELDAAVDAGHMHADYATLAAQDRFVRKDTKKNRLRLRREEEEEAYA